MARQKTMKALIFHGPYKVGIEERPVPTIQEGTDIIVKVQYSAICGSELHVYRGHEESTPGFIMGHEFTGEVVEVGSDVKTVKKGDMVVAPFTTSCGKCFYCTNNFSSRCANGRLFGSQKLDGGSAEYVRIPHADGTVMVAPPSIHPQALVLMADIFPTGFYGATNGFASLSPAQIAESTAVVIGCGPVGLCAIIAAKSLGPKHLFAVDGVESRLTLAKKLGAEPLNFNQLSKEEMVAKVKEVTDGRGADVAIEVVGLSPALRTAFDLLRPFGVISSVGVHNREIPYDGPEAYGKNLRIQTGRCPVRSIFPQALKLLEQKQDLLGFMFENIMPLSDAETGFDLFDKMKVQKVVLEVDRKV